VEGEGGGGPSVAGLAPSLTPASQPNISLLTDGAAETLSVESLTLMPPADSPHLHPCAGHGAAIAEEEEEEGEGGEKEGQWKGEQREEEEEEEGPPTDETRKEELVTPADEEPEVKRLSAAELLEGDEDTPDSPELD